MQFSLSKSGTVTACREALNEAIAALPLPESQENKVVRMIAHHIVADHLDPIHDKWQRGVNDIRAFNLEAEEKGRDKLPEPTEPSASFNISCTVSFGG